MKTNQVLKFFATIVALLAALSLIFPKGGIDTGKHILRFPTIHKVLTRNTPGYKPKTNSSSNNIQTNSRGNDTIQSLYADLFNSHNRIWLPDNNLSFFDNFFAEAENATKEHRVVRIVHYGDSQIEGDRISCRLRERMQSEFGGGGPGMLPLKQPIPSISVNQSIKGNTIGQSTYGGKPMVRTKGDYGPMLRSWRVDGTVTVSIEASKQRTAPERVKKFSRIRLICCNRPGPTTISLNGSNNRQSHDSGIQMFEWSLDSATSTVQLTVQGHSDIYGIMVDDGFGVAVDNISMRGVSGNQFTMVDSTKLDKSFKMMDVGRIVMQVGGNTVPYLNSEKAIDHYCKQIGRQMDYLHHVCPQATILFVGPSDMSTKIDGELATYPLLPSLVCRLRETANAHDVAFWSIFDVMGGKNSMIEWLELGLAERDYIHFNQKGAAIVGDSLCNALQRMYDIYKLKNNS